MMEHFNVSVVCHGKTPVMHDEDGSDPYGFPRWRFSKPQLVILYIGTSGRRGRWWWWILGTLSPRRCWSRGSLQGDFQREANTRVEPSFGNSSPKCKSFYFVNICTTSSIQAVGVWGEEQEERGEGDGRLRGIAESSSKKLNKYFARPSQTFQFNGLWYPSRLCWIFRIRLTVGE